MYGREAIPDPYDMEDPEVREKRLKGPDGKYIVPKMKGWPQNYCDGILHHHDDPGMILRKEHVSEILDMYLPDQLPVMSGLARNYAVSDLWFCSVPSQTNTNRAFWIVGSAAGLVTNDWDPVLKRMDKVKHFAADRLPEGLNRSLFDVLEENQVDWGYYWSMKWPPKFCPEGSCYLTNMCPRFLHPKYEDNLRNIEDFFRDLKQDKLKTVTYLEPYWGGGGFWFTSDGTKRGVGNEFHPVQDVFNGEFFVKRVHDALAKSGKWESTLLVITFDENGGTYDHFPPWPATPPGREPEKDGKLATQFGFKFDCYGVRVPTLLISSHIKPQTLFRPDTEVPFDHTSIIATILKWQQIDPQTWKLGNRVANAPTFDRVLDNPSDPADPRRFAATGMGLVDGSRDARRAKTTLKFGDRFKLKYVGNKWAKEPPVGGYLGGPKNWANWWYAVCANADHPEMKLQFVGEPGQEVKVDSPMAIRVASGKAEGRTLAVAEVIKASTVYLYDGKNPSLWVPWLVNERCEGVPLCPGDEIYLLSERYLPERLAQFMTASATGGESGQTSGTWYDPYQRLCLDPFDPKHPKVVRYARWRAGEWTSGGSRRRPASIEPESQVQVGAERGSVQRGGSRALQHHRLDIRRWRDFQEVNTHPAAQPDHEGTDEYLEGGPHSHERRPGGVRTVIGVDNGRVPARKGGHPFWAKTRTRDAVTTSFAEQLQLDPVRNRDEQTDRAGKEQVAHVSDRETGGRATKHRTRRRPGANRTATGPTHRPSPSTGCGPAHRRRPQRHPGATRPMARRAAAARDRRSSRVLIHADREGRTQPFNHRGGTFDDASSNQVRGHGGCALSMSKLVPGQVPCGSARHAS